MKASTLALFAVAILLGAPATFLAVQWWRVDRLSTELVAQAAELAARAPERPSHVDAPIDGTFGELAAPALAELAAARATARTEQLREPCRAIWASNDPRAPPSDACAAALDAHQAAVSSLLRATHAARGGLPQAIRFPDGGEFAGLDLAISLAAVRVRREFDQGPAAVATCLDGLALAREASLTGGIGGAMLASRGFHALAQPCAAALQAAPRAVRLDSAKRILRIRDGVAPARQMVLDHAPTELLRAYGSLISAAARAQLPAGALKLAADSAPLNGVRKLIGLQLFTGSWTAYNERIARALPLFDLPAKDRIAGLRELQGQGGALPRQAFAPDWALLAANVDLGVATLELVAAVALYSVYREDHGRWPGGAEGEALLGAFVQPLPRSFNYGSRTVLQLHDYFPPAVNVPLQLALSAGPSL